MNTIIKSTTQGVAGGELLLVIHGWGMSSSVWEMIEQSLEKHFQVTWLDLPGHGENRALEAGSLSEIVDHILPLIKQATHIMGWSLGGLIAQEVIRRKPELIKSVVMVASTPRFSQSLNWENAMSKNILTAFSDNLLKDIKGTIKRFIALQFMGVKGSQTIQRELRDSLLKKLPAKSALMTGLAILRHQDFREFVIPHRSLWVLGEKDRLVPVALEGDLRKLYPDAKLHVIVNAGHAPFMTHPIQFVDVVIKFLSTT